MASREKVPLPVPVLFIFEINFKVSLDLINKNFWMYNLEIIHLPQTVYLVTRIATIVPNITYQGVDEPLHAVGTSIDFTFARRS